MVGGTIPLPPPPTPPPPPLTRYARSGSVASLPRIITFSLQTHPLLEKPGVKKHFTLFIVNNFLPNSWMTLTFWIYIAEEYTILWV